MFIKLYYFITKKIMEIKGENISFYIQKLLKKFFVYSFIWKKVFFPNEFFYYFQNEYWEKQYLLDIIEWFITKYNINKNSDLYWVLEQDNIEITKDLFNLEQKKISIESDIFWYNEIFEEELKNIFIDIDKDKVLQEIFIDQKFEIFDNYLFLEWEEYDVFFVKKSIDNVIDFTTKLKNHTLIFFEWYDKLKFDWEPDEIWPSLKKTIWILCKKKQKSWLNIFFKDIEKFL